MIILSDSILFCYFVDTPKIKNMENNKNKENNMAKDRDKEKEKTVEFMTGVS